MNGWLKRLGRQDGTSLMELMFVLAMTAVTLTTLVRFIMRSRGDMSRVECTTALHYANHRINDNLNATMNSALVYVADYGGAPDMSSLHTIMYNSVSASATAPPPVTFSAQPIVQNANMPVFSPGSASDMAPYVGNELYMEVSIAPVTFTVCLSNTTTAATITSILSSPCTGTSIGYTMSIDRVQFVSEYLAKKPGPSMKNGLPPLRLVEWRSRPYVRYNSLSEMAQTGGTLMTATCQALTSLGYNLAIGDSVSDTAQNYISFNSSAAFSGGSAPATFPEASWAYVDEFNLTQVYKGLSTTATAGRVRTDRTFAGYVAPATFSFAYNSRTSTAVPSPQVSFTGASRNGGQLAVPAIAQIDRGGPGFPGGFEVLIVGRPGAREVLVQYTDMMNASDSVSRGRTQFLGMDDQTYATSDTSQ